MLRAVRLAQKLSLQHRSRRHNQPIRDGHADRERPAGEALRRDAQVAVLGHAVTCLKQLREEACIMACSLLDVILEQPRGERFVWLSLDNTDQRPPGAGVARIPLRDPALARGPAAWGNPFAEGEAALSSPVCGNDQVLEQQAGKLAITRRIAGDIKDIWPSSRVSTSAPGRLPTASSSSPLSRGMGLPGCERSRLNCQMELADWWERFARAGHDERAAMLEPETDGPARKATAAATKKHPRVPPKGREREPPLLHSPSSRARRQPQRSRRNLRSAASSLDHLPETRVVARSKAFDRFPSGSANKSTTSIRWCRSGDMPDPRSLRRSARHRGQTWTRPSAPDGSIVRSISTCCSTTSLRSTSLTSGAAPTNAFTRLRTASAAKSRPISTSWVTDSSTKGSRESDQRISKLPGDGPEGSRLYGHVPWNHQVAGRMDYLGGTKLLTGGHQPWCISCLSSKTCCT